MNEEKNPRMRSGGGQGQARRFGGRMGGTKKIGPSGECVCPQCGAIVPHKRGLPCMETKCPSCGAVLTRR